MVEITGINLSCAFHQARDLLTPPASTTASEFAFNTGGRVLTDTRNRLASDTIEIIICGKDWLDAEKRSQNKTINDLIEDFPKDSQKMNEDLYFFIYD